MNENLDDIIERLKQLEKDLKLLKESFNRDMADQWAMIEQQGEKE